LLEAKPLKGPMTGDGKRGGGLSALLGRKNSCTPVVKRKGKTTTNPKEEGKEEKIQSLSRGK